MASLLPWWVRWAPLLLFVPAALVLSFLTSTLIVAIAGRRPPPADAHWMERARLTWPGRRAAGLSVLAQAVVWGAVGAGYSTRLSAVSWRIAAPACMLAALVGAWANALRVERRLRGPAPLGSWVRQRLTRFVVLYPHLLVAIAGMGLAGDRFSLRSALVMAGVVATLLAILRGGGLKVGRGLGLVFPASPRLRAAMELAARSSSRPTAAFELDLGVANAFALPPARSVAVTREAIALLTDDELAAVCGHELGHVEEPRRLSVLRAAVTLSILVPAVLGRALMSSFGAAGLLASMVPILFVLVRFRRVSRSAEADADAHAHGGAAPGVYARALEKLYRHNMVPAVLAGRGASHPHLYDRLLAAGVAPEVPRPEPPPRRLRLAVGAMLGLAAATYLLPWAVTAGFWLARGHEGGERACLLAVAIGGSGAASLDDLALYRFHHGDVDGAVGLYGLAAELDPEDPFAPAMQAVSLAYEDRCGAADLALGIATSRISTDTSSAVKNDVRDAAGAVGDCRDRARP